MTKLWKDVTVGDTVYLSYVSDYEGTTAVAMSVIGVIVTDIEDDLHYNVRKISFKETGIGDVMRYLELTPSELSKNRVIEHDMVYFSDELEAESYKRQMYTAMLESARYEYRLAAKILEKIETNMKK